jgi:hypothetical protein
MHKIAILCTLAAILCAPGAIQAAEIEMNASVQTRSVDDYPGESLDSEDFREWKGAAIASCRLIKYGRAYKRNRFAAPAIDQVVTSCESSSPCLCNRLGEWDQGINYLMPGLSEPASGE